MLDKIQSILDGLKPAVKVAKQVIEVTEDTIPAAELLLAATRTDGADHAAKKAELVKVVQAAINEPGGIPEFPDALKPYEPMILAAGIGALILLLRKGQAGFKKGSES